MSLLSDGRKPNRRTKCAHREGFGKTLNPVLFLVRPVITFDTMEPKRNRWSVNCTVESGIGNSLNLVATYGHFI